ncbi:MAG: hypothetical protein NVSMB64_33130 [Candidatus Velthaea sp.]
MTIALAACGGGSSGGGASSSAPVVPAGPTVANTSASQYLPESQGNVWTFSSGGSIRDLGAGNLVCSCAISGVPLENFGFYSPSGSLSGIFYFTKGVYPNGVLSGRFITYLTGVSNDGGATILLSAYSLDGSITGIGSIDDNPTAGEMFTFTPGLAFQPSDISTITSIGGTQLYGSNQIITSIAQDTLQSGTANFGFGYARGVGFVNISAQGQTMMISSFSINATTAHASGRNVEGTRAVLARAATESERNVAATIVAGLFQR